jgi:hypothetical protein
MMFYLLMYPEHEVSRVTGFSEDLQLQIKIFVPDGNGTALHEILEETVHTRTISCPQSPDGVSVIFSF